MPTLAETVAERFGIKVDVVESALKNPAVAALASFVLDPNRANAAIHPDSVRRRTPKPGCSLFTLQRQETGTTS